MNEREIRDAIKRARSGSEEARDAFARQFERLVCHIANKYAHRDPRIERDDLEQEGRMAVIASIDRFDLRRKVRVVTYVYQCIWTAVFDAMRREARKRDSLLGELASDVPARQDLDRPDPEDILPLLDELDDRRRRVIEATLEGVPASVIADWYGVSDKRIYQIKGDAIRKLQKLAERRAA